MILKDGSNAFKLEWYYGYVYDAVDSYAKVYYLIPFNYLVRFKYWLRAKKYQIIRYCVQTFPICRMILVWWLRRK